MADAYCYAYVEDQPSAHIARRLLEHRNTTMASKLLFNDGFPVINHGCSELKKES